MPNNKYETIIGLEVHLQLLTNSKAFSREGAEFGLEPNSQVSEITLAHPGTLPYPNQKHIEFAVKLGLVCNCDIRKNIEFARKNYFYPDMPKGYQISQQDDPICENGYIAIKTKDGKSKKISLVRIHLEEDSGKSIHDLDPYNTLIDLNRAGTSLVEIVSQPEIKSGDEAYSYLSEIRKIARYLEISDGNMEEASLRCDVNISVKLKDETILGTRVEIKNLNSFSSVKKAIEYETDRQIKAIENGEKIVQETRTFDVAKNKTILLRLKETASDYRYFPEPDIPPVNIDDNYIQKIKNELPQMPEALYKKYTEEFMLSDYDANILTESRDISSYFNEIVKHTNNYKLSANFLMGPIKSFLNKEAINIKEFGILPQKIAEIIELINSKKININIAEQKLLPLLIQNKDKSVKVLVEDNLLLQSENEDEIKVLVEAVLAKYPQKVAEYKSGKTGLIGLFVGEVIKLSKGKANPQKVNQLINELIAD